MPSRMSDQGRENAPVRLASRLASLVWRLLLAVLVLLALYAGIGRQLTQNISDYRSEIEQRLSEELGYPVTIAHVSARWQWLDPILEARGIVVSRPQPPDATGDPTQEAAVGSLRHLRIRLDSLTSLLRFRIVFANFEADGLELTFDRKASGEVVIEDAGFALSDSGGVARWLDLAGAWLSDPSVRITRVNLGIRDADNQIRYVDIPQLDLIYQRGLFYASGRAMQAGTTQQLASFRLLGRHFFRGDFTGQLYVDVNSGRFFDGLIQDIRWRDISVEGFDIGGRGWLTFRDGRLEQASGTLETPYLQLRVGQESLAPLEHIQAEFGWRRPLDDAGNGSQAGTRADLHLRNLAWKWMDDQVSPFSLRVREREDVLHIHGNEIPVGPLRRLVASLRLLPEQAEEALENYRPKGRLDQLAVTLPWAGSEGFGLSAELENVSVEAYRGAPAASGIKGWLVMDHDSGHVVVDAPNLELAFPELFRDGWTFSHLRGTVAWQMAGPLTRIYADDIRMDYGSGTKFDGAFDLRMDREGEDNLGLKVGVRNADAGMLADFVPVHKVGPGLYQWLTTAIAKADIEDGVFYGHGLISEGAPRGSFTTSMRYRFRNAVVRYDEQWPAVADAAGEVFVHNGDTQVNVESGVTGGLVLAPGQVRVVPDAGGTTTVHVDASAPVPGSAVGYWMEHSPLGGMAGVAAQGLEFEGNYQLDLGLVLPLDSSREVGVNARLRTLDGKVSYPAANLEWSNLAGDLNFSTADGFSGKPLTAQFMGKPVNVTFSRSEGGSEGERALRIRQAGRLDVEDVLALLNAPATADVGASGAFNYRATLDVTPDAASGISFYSSFQGLALDWPAPVGKSAEEEVPVRAVLDLQGREGLELAGTWQDRLAFRLNWDDSGFRRGRVALAANSADPGTEEGLVVSGYLAELDSDQWQESIDRLRSSLAASDQALIATGEAAHYPAWFNRFALDIGRFELMGHTFPDIRVTARPSIDGWVVDTSSERATGRVRVPINSDDPVTVDFQQLRLARGEAAEQEKVQVNPLRSLSFENWPDIDVTIADLRMGDDQLGQWSFALRPGLTLLRVESIQGRMKSLNFNGELSWSQAGSREGTLLTGEITGGALADLSELIGEEIPLRNAQSQALIDVHWPGRPDEISLPSLSGTVSLRLDEGVILERNNTAQLFRVFNILNSDNLWRRLRLDFSDLYKAGVAFDAISGTAQLNQGLLTWEPELQIVGPSGAFKLSGTTNMVEESLDMRLVVVLPLTQNLPLAAILMGASAPIGGALFVLDKVLGDPLSKLTSATYSVTGSWDNPDVRLRSVFDTGN